MGLLFEAKNLRSIWLDLGLNNITKVGVQSLVGLRNAPKVQRLYLDIRRTKLVGDFQMTDIKTSIEKITHFLFIHLSLSLSCGNLCLLILMWTFF